MTLGSLFGVVYYVLQLPMSPITDVQSGVAGVYYLAAVLLLPLYPVACSTALCALSVATSLIPLVFGGPQAYAGVWFALGVLGFMGTPLYAVACMLATVLSISTDIVLHFWDKPGALPSLIGIDSTYLIALVLGFGVRKWGERQSRLASQQAAYERQQEQLRLLHSAHDSIAGKLAGAMMVCRLHGDGSSDARDWSTVELLLQQALHELRENIINPAKLSVAPSQRQVTTAGDVALRFHNTVGEIEATMRLLHFRGGIAVSGPVNAVSADKLAVCVDLLREIHTNIIRHGIPGPYATTVTFGDDVTDDDVTVHIVSTNLTEERPDETGADSGMALMRQSIAPYHGTVSHAVEDGEWTIAITY
ncbi:hypothetical protein G1C96_0892 [Bifidobacterium sp. DSM 109958]|uniref:Signal transduction histidine kinase subgroup 3 dimerisation and phosphoacceptor domain-containing protein n=1 Tax=Bifidobacterium moraviense TaxID=2675323 RepID=A0A7Y0F1I1_9BIFI|nr:hypothetical protein [Bifidobacterium sp. DSM 109958]NMN00314.1 hypothetical protein [Bifidobacterium sp. DSM 109958]